MKGIFLGASVPVIDGSTDPETMEACLQRGPDVLRKMKLASDNVNVVRRISGEGPGPYGQIIHEIKVQAKALQSCGVVHDRV